MRKPPPRPASLGIIVGVAVLAGAATAGVQALGFDRLVGYIILTVVAIAGILLARRLRDRPWNRWEPRWGRHHAMACTYLTMAVGFMIFSATMMAGSGSALVRLTSMPNSMGMFLGLGIGALGVVRLTGGRYCSKCRYEMSEVIAADAAQQQCPECGAFWKRPGGTRDDHLTLRWPWIIAGVIVGLTLTVSPLLAISRPGLRIVPMGILPTSSLIEEAATGFSSTRDAAWTELMVRDLTPEQEKRLATRLLDARLDRGYMHSTGDSWFQQRSDAGTLAPGLAERYVVEHPHPIVLEARKYLSAPPAPAQATDPDAP